MIMSAPYQPRHAPLPRASLTHILLAGADAAVMAVAVLAVVLASLALTKTPPVTARAPVSASAPVHATPAPVTSQRTARARTAAPLPYVVQSGDSLWSVSVWYYGDRASWPRIWSANRAVIGSNPGKIYPGELLTFP